MAIPTSEVFKTLTISDFTTEYIFKPSIFDEVFPRRRTVRDVEREVAKLKSVSAAGRAWIVDERCSWLSIGRHANTIRFKTR